MPVWPLGTFLRLWALTQTANILTFPWLEVPCPHPQDQLLPRDPGHWGQPAPLRLLLTAAGTLG